MIRLLFGTLNLVMFLSIPSAGQPLRAMSYNIRYDNPGDGLNAWSNRKEFLLAQVQRLNPDILGIQESLPSQVTYLASALSAYDHVGVGRDENGQGESTTLFFKRSRFELVEHHQFWLSDTPDKVSRGWDAAIRRICTYAMLRDKVTNQRFWVFNTHFDHVGVEARKKSADLLLKKINEASNDYLPVVPVILMGDFNATPTSETIQILGNILSDSRVVARAIESGAEGSFNGFDFSKPATQLIDYIFVTHQFKVIHYAMPVEIKDARYPSDHFPIVVDVSLPAGFK